VAQGATCREVLVSLKIRFFLRLQSPGCGEDYDRFRSVSMRR